MRPKRGQVLFHEESGAVGRVVSVSYLGEVTLLVPTEDSGEHLVLEDLSGWEVFSGIPWKDFSSLVEEVVGGHSD